MDCLFEKAVNFTNKYYKYIVILIFALFLFRIYGLDKDLPNYGIAYYQAKDEGQYSMMALNLYHYGNLLNTGDFILHISPTFIANVIGNGLQYVCMLIFGDNYYGFRIIYTIFSFLTLFLIYKSINILNEEYKKNSKSNKLLICGILLYCLCDFSFLMMGRTVENSCVRALMTSLIILLFISIKNEKTKYFLVGLLSILSIFFIYFSNVHILISLFLMILYSAIRNDITKLKVQCIYGGLGILVGNLVSEIFYFKLWGSGCWSFFIDSISSFSQRIVSSDSAASVGVFEKMIKGFFTFFDSNMFFFSIIICILTLIFIFINLYFGVKDKNDLIVFIVFIILSMLVQSILTSDAMERKAISIYPAIIVNLFIGFQNFRRVSIKSTKLNYSFNFIIIGTVLVLIYTMIRFHKSARYFLDFVSIDYYVWLLLTFLGVVAFYLLLFGKKKKLFKISFLICYISCLSLNCYFSIKYVYTYNSYTEKDAMIGIGDIVKDNYVIGPYTYGYTLYNDLRPVWRSTDLGREFANSNKIQYFCDYYNGPFYVNAMAGGRYYYSVAKFNRNLIAQGTEFPIGLFRKGW